MASATAIIGAAGSAISAGSSLMGMFGGNDGSAAAASAAEQQAEAGQLNLMRMVLENQRVQAQIALEREWAAFDYDDQARWLSTWTGVDVAYTKAGANLEKQTLFTEAASTIEGNTVAMGNAVDLAVTLASGVRSDALKTAELTNMLARAKATTAAAEGESTVRAVERERAYAMDELTRETRSADGEFRAAIAARGQAATGSALDVLVANQDLALKKQRYLASKSAAEITDAKFQSGMEASATLQSGHVQAWETLSDALQTTTKYLMQAEDVVEETNVKAQAISRVLGTKLDQIDLATDYKVAGLEIQGAREADMLRREGWREDFLAERESYNTLWNIQYAMMDEMFGISSNLAAADAYGSAGTDWGSVASGAAGVAKSLTGIWSAGKDAGWWSSSSSGSPGSSLLDFSPVDVTNVDWGQFSWFGS